MWWIVLAVTLGVFAAFAIVFSILGDVATANGVITAGIFAVVVLVGWKLAGWRQRLWERAAERRLRGQRRRWWWW
jgi:hypothetical protein